MSDWLVAHAAPAIGLFWDYASLPQKPRRGWEEEHMFKDGLAAITKFYGSLWRSTVIQVKELPSAPAGETYNERPYSDRGWCVVEEGVARFAARNRFRAANSNRKQWDFPKLIDISEGVPKVPDLNDESCSIEYIENALSNATFTGKGDREVVTKQLREFHTILSLQRYTKHTLNRVRPVEEDV